MILVTIFITSIMRAALIPDFLDEILVIMDFSTAVIDVLQDD